MDGRIFSAGSPVLHAIPGGGLVMKGVKIMRLRNGMTLAVREDARFPQTVFRLEVKAGPAWESEEEAGISHLVEHMAFITGEEGKDFHSLVESAGGSVSAATSRDHTTYLVEMPSARWREGLALMHRLVFEMSLTQEAFEAERRIVVAELREAASDQERLVFDRSLERLFAGTPYGRAIVGTEESLAGLDVGMVRDYVRRRYVPRDMVFSVVGDVDAGSLLEEADALFGAHPNAVPLSHASSVSFDSLPRGLSVDVEHGNLFGFEIAMAFPIPFVTPKLGAALVVLSELLDGSDTSYLKGRLCFGDAVAKEVKTAYEAFEQGGVFLIEVFARQENAEACLRRLAQAVAGLDDPAFSDEQIRQACARLADGNRKVLQSAEIIAEIISDENLHPRSGPEGWIPVPEFRDIGREQIRQAIGLCFRPEAVSVTMVTEDFSDAPVPDEAAIRAILAEGWPALGRETQAEAAEAEHAGMPEVVGLGEGRSVILLPDASLPLVAATLCFSGGEALAEELGENGMATLAGMFPSGLLGDSWQDTVAWLYEHSASLHASRTMEGFCLHMASPARYASEVFALMGKAVAAPVFHGEIFDHEKGLVSMEDDRCVRIFELIRFLFLKVGAYGRRCGPDGPEAQTFAGVQALWKAQCARPWTLGVAGDFDREAVLAFARSLPIPSASSPRAGEPVWEEFEPLSTVCGPSEQALYALCFRAPGEGSPDRPTLHLLLRCLNGGGGLLYRALRTERQLCYSADALDWCEAEAGFTGIFLQTDPEHLDEAADVLEGLIRRVQEEGLDEEELARGRAIALTAFQKRFERLEIRAMEAATQVGQGRGLDFFRRWQEALLAVTSDDVREVARRWFDLERPIELCMEPEEGPAEE